jgi:tRNA dimethylallyltransferase
VPSQAGQQQQPQPELPDPLQPVAGQETAAAAAAAAADTAEELAALSRFLPVDPASAAAAAQLQPQQRWDVAVDVVQQLGDAEAAARIRAERNNWYRLQRVLQILIINGGKPLSQLDIDTTKELDFDFRWAIWVNCNSCGLLHGERLG